MAKDGPEARNRTHEHCAGRLEPPRSPQRLETVADNPDVPEFQLARGALDESRLLFARLEQGESRRGPEHREGYAGKPGSRADIERGFWRLGEEREGIQRIENVAGEDMGPIALGDDRLLGGLPVNQESEADEELEGMSRGPRRRRDRGRLSLERGLDPRAEGLQIGRDVGGDLRVGRGAALAPHRLPGPPRRPVRSPRSGPPARPFAA